MADLLDDVRDLLPRNFELAECCLIDGETRFRVPSEIENNFD
ncbi:MAG: hypothetical protein QF590_03705 [Dehalococcoidia bacterium]|nr:hypothetical protein [Dehalococcoidia bacterium]